MSQFDKNQQALLRLASIESISLKKKFDIINNVECFSDIFETDICEYIKLTAQQKADIKKAATEEYLLNILKSLRTLNVTPIFINSENYPSAFYDLKVPPIVIFARGDLTLLNSKPIGVIGTRYPDAYGQRVTANFVSELSLNGINTISGMARGVDSIAHKTSIENGAKTIAVLGSGIDVIYPPENNKLYYDIIKNGLVISEYFCGSLPSQYHFPERNRLVAALSEALLVTEAGEKSGAIITVNDAIELNKPIYAVPSTVFSSKSAGSNLMLAENKAKIALSAKQIMPIFCKQCGKITERTPIQLNFEEDMVYNSLREGEKHFEELLLLTSFDAVALSAVLMNMELKGILTKQPGNYYSLNS